MRLAAAAVGPVAAAVLGASLLIGGSAGGRPAGTAPKVASGRATPGGIELQKPTTLAVSANGTLYVMDPARDQVLRLTRHNRLVVFAGSGRRGFAGDGGPARRARLRLDGGGLTVGANGTVYIADSGNGRVRAVLPNGTIETVMRDRRATGRPFGLALGPGGELYIDADALYRLDPATGALRAIVTPTRRPVTDQEIWKDEFAYSGDIAVNGAGDLFLVNFPQLFERLPSGRILFLGDGMRAGGGPAPMAVGGNGELYGGFPGGIGRVSDAVAAPLGSLVRVGRSIVPLAPVERALRSDTLGPPDGLAISSNGTVYYDTDSGDGWIAGALVEIAPDGTVRVLWRARG